MDAIEKRIRGVAVDANRAFADHQITVRSDAGMYRSWRIGRPQSGFYAMNITIEPNRIFVTGDCGVLVLQREWDMLAWLKQSIGDYHYVAEKVPNEIKVHEFDEERAKEWIAQQCVREYPLRGFAVRTLNDYWVGFEGSNYVPEIHHARELDEEADRRMTWDEAEELRNAAESGEEEFRAAFWRSKAAHDGVEYPGCENFTHRFLWQMEGLKWWLAHLPTVPESRRGVSGRPHHDTGRAC